MVLAAEAAIKQSGQGAQKKQLVIDWVYDRIPPVLKWLLSKAVIGDLIDNNS